ncbi:hypothetical protein Q7P35_009112 [Cladosporium inversicolor]
MCVFALSVIKTCQHELPTIKFCRRVGRDIPEDTNEAAIASGEEPLPRMTCTDSLGWLIFERLNAPVTCESCKAWLEKNGKLTYGEVMDEVKELISKDDQKDEVAPVKRSRGSIVYTSKGPALPGSPATRRKPK